MPVAADAGATTGASAASKSAVFFTALGFADRGNATTFLMGPETLGRSVDFAAPSPQDFSSVPSAAFSGDGGSDLGGGTYVWFRSATLVAQVQPSEPAATWKSAGLSSTSPAPLALVAGVPDLLHASPVLGGIALLGEANKVAAVSSFRFASITPAASGSTGLTASLRGAPKETVTLLYSEGISGGTIKTKTTTLGADGTGTVVLGARMARGGMQSM